MVWFGFCPPIPNACKCRLQRMEEKTKTTTSQLRPKIPNHLAPTKRQLQQSHRERASRHLQDHSRSEAQLAHSHVSVFFVPTCRLQVTDHWGLRTQRHGNRIATQALLLPGTGSGDISESFPLQTTNCPG